MSVACPTCGQAMPRPAFRLDGEIHEDEDAWPRREGAFVLRWHNDRTSPDGCGLLDFKEDRAAVARIAGYFVVGPSPLDNMADLSTAAVVAAATEAAADLGATEDERHQLWWPKSVGPRALAERITSRAKEIAAKAIEAARAAQEKP